MKIHPGVSREITEYINDVYGAYRFIGEGGDIQYTPEAIIISSPALSDKLKKDIVGQFPNVPILFFSGRQDVGSNDMTNLHAALVDYLIKAYHPEQPVMVSIRFCPCFLLLEPTDPIPDNIVEGMRKIIDKTSIGRVLFISPEAEVLVWDKSVKSEKKTVPAKDERKTVIAADDVTNLKIALGKDMDVMDFLKEIEGR